MNRRNSPIACVGLGVLCAALSLQSYGQTELSRITPTDGSAGENFGNAVAISGNTVIVGAWREGLPTNAGAAYIFEDNGSGWVQQKLTATNAGLNDRASGDEFGVSVAISGNWAAVGSWRDTHVLIPSGSVYLYERVGGTWVARQKLVAIDRAASDNFGAAVALEGNTLVIGADQNFTSSTKSGVAYVFQLVAGVWIQQTELTPPDGAATDAFGRSVAISGNTIVVGAPQDEPVGSPNSFNSGSAYVFENNGISWGFATKLTPPGAASGDRTGFAVSISGDFIALGSEFHDQAGNNAGAVHMYQRAAGSWAAHSKLTASDAADGNAFGNSVSLNGGSMVVGSYGDAGQSGSAYVFQFDGSEWIESAEKLQASDGAELTQFSRGAVALGENDLIVIGCAGHTANGIGSGAAYVFQVTAGGEDPDSDSDGDGLLDSTEIEMAAGTGCPDPDNWDSDGDGLSDGEEVDQGTNPCSCDTDGDGLRDDVDPTPTEPGAPSNFVEVITRAVGDDILTIELTTFNGANANANKGRRNALANRVSDAANAIAAGDYASALQALNSLLEKIDGQPSPPDWMSDGPQKSALLQEVEFLIALVELLQ